MKYRTAEEEFLPVVCADRSDHAASESDRCLETGADHPSVTDSGRNSGADERLSVDHFYGTNRYFSL